MASMPEEIIQEITPERWRRAKQIFQAAMKLPSASPASFQSSSQYGCPKLFMQETGGKRLTESK